MNPGTIGLIRPKVALFIFPLFGELSRSSRDSFEPDSDSNESRDDGLNSLKSGIFHFSFFFVSLRRGRQPRSRVVEVVLTGARLAEHWDD